MSLDLLRKSLNECPILDKNGYCYFIHPLTDGIPSISPDLLDESASAIIDAADLNCDRIVATEAMGIPIATAVSLRTGIPVSVVRKRSYGLPDERTIEQRTGYSEGKLFVNGLKKGDRVTVIDDVLSTGGTMRSLLSTLIEDIGCEVVDAMVIIDKSEQDLHFEERYGLSVKYLLKIRITDGRIEIQN